MASHSGGDARKNPEKGDSRTCRLPHHASPILCGSDAADNAPLVSTPSSSSTKMCGINPQAYLADVLERIAGHPINKIDSLLTWLWTIAQVRSSTEASMQRS